MMGVLFLLITNMKSGSPFKNPSRPGADLRGAGGGRPPRRGREKGKEKREKGKGGKREKGSEEIDCALPHPPRPSPIFCRLQSF